MTRRALFASCFALAIVSCGDDGGENAPPDAAQPDGTAASVVMVTCPATPAATVTTSDVSFVYTPADTVITQGQVVKFTMSGTHNVAPTPGMSDPGLAVGFGEEKCLMFTQTGTFKFFCTPHGFGGMVTVN